MNLLFGQHLPFPEKNCNTVGSILEDAKITIRKAYAGWHRSHTEKIRHIVPARP